MPFTHRKSRYESHSLHCTQLPAAYNVGRRSGSSTIGTSHFLLLTLSCISCIFIIVWFQVLLMTSSLLPINSINSYSSSLVAVLINSMRIYKKSRSGSTRYASTRSSNNNILLLLLLLKVTRSMLYLLWYIWSIKPLLNWNIVGAKSLLKDFI